MTRPFFFSWPAIATMADLVVSHNAFSQSSGDGLSVADPTLEAFSTQRLDELQKVIQSGDFNAITSMVIARGKVPANCGHGTDMFKLHPELPGIIVDWLVTTLIKTSGHAPADTVASAPILDQVRMPGGAAQVTQQLMEARRRDPHAQLFRKLPSALQAKTICAQARRS